MVRLNKIYTRTGDAGTTGLGTGARVRKDDVRISAYGTVDETNALIGVARLHTAGQPGLDAKLSRACQHPDNLWSLHGLHECLVRRGEKVEAPLIKQRLDLAAARGEIPIKASCFCRRTAMAAE